MSQSLARRHPIYFEIRQRQQVIARQARKQAAVAALHGLRPILITASPEYVATRTFSQTARLAVAKQGLFIASLHRLNYPPPARGSKLVRGLAV
jgi:hypothetical protein